MLKQYTVTFEFPNVHEFMKLRNKVGWKELDPIMTEKSLLNSLFCVVIRDETVLVAMARVDGDGTMCFFIQDVMVDPSYQKQGLGNKLMEHIELYLDETAKNGAVVALLVDAGKEDFYKRFGYIKKPPSALGNGMCKFIVK
jgi:GNAT superfamily N-acetyltransferase